MSRPTASPACIAGSAAVASPWRLAAVSGVSVRVAIRSGSSSGPTSPPRSSWRRCPTARLCLQYPNACASISATIASSWVSLQDALGALPVWPSKSGEVTLPGLL